MPSALTIAGSDSSGRAGIQADLRTFEALGVRGATAITAITAQNAQGVSAIAPLSADLVTAQIEAVAAGAEIVATKIGMLGTAAIAEAVAAAIEDLELPLVVLDPVLASTSGTRLLDADGVQTLVTELLPRVLVVTPNLPEAEALSGMRIDSIARARDAARRLHEMGAENVIVKGGHGLASTTLGGARDGGVEAPDVLDILFDGKAFHELRVARVHGRMRGTGCSYSSAVAAFLALGRALPDAAAQAQRHVAGLIAQEAGGARNARRAGGAERERYTEE
jgi:hydroxymethylpyrimidine/phosphomethylpyrimidine kinase